MAPIEVVQLDAAGVRKAEDDLAGLLVDAVAGGASVGFTPPFGAGDALRYWRGAAEAVEAGRTRLLVARRDGRLTGTVQLQFAAFPNGRHRAEVAKLLVHSTARRHGIGRRLMEAVEALALAEGKSLLLLDTQTDSPAERLYLGLGWEIAGYIPGHAYAPDGLRYPTTLFFKALDE